MWVRIPPRAPSVLAECETRRMSIPVPLDALANEAATRPLCYLLTVADDGRPHAVAVRPQFDGYEIVALVGRRSTTHAKARPVASLLFPPTQVEGYSLIVDAAVASVMPNPCVGSPDTHQVRLRPTRAVLHRPAVEPRRTAADGDCTSDCINLPV